MSSESHAELLTDKNERSPESRLFEAKRCAELRQEHNAASEF
jgi:hypothetical protein